MVGSYLNPTDSCAAPLLGMLPFRGGIRTAREGRGGAGAGNRMLYFRKRENNTGELLNSESTQLRALTKKGGKSDTAHRSLIRGKIVMITAIQHHSCHQVSIPFPLQSGSRAFSLFSLSTYISGCPWPRPEKTWEHHVFKSVLLSSSLSSHLPVFLVV